MKYRIHSFALAIHAVVVSLAVIGTTTVVKARKVKAEKRNVFGEPIEPCSSEGMGKTGFVRDGSCMFVTLDEGYHTICLDVPSVQGGDFCNMTNQRDWCGRGMPCSDDPDYECPVAHWCVEEWAFEDYLDKSAGGCDDIGRVYCESTNMIAVLNYERLAEVGNEKARVALECLKKKCWLP